MANLKTAINSAFWDQNLSTPLTIEGTARSVPGEPFPLDGARASRALRIQQISLLSNGFPLGIIPSLSPASQKELGSFSLQSLLLKPATSNWWLGLVGQFRPKKLFSDIKAEFSKGEGWDLPVFRDAAKHVLDKSLYAFSCWSQLALTAEASLLVSTERHGDKKGKRNKFMFLHQLPNHDLTLEAAWPDLFLDHKGQYWDVPESISLDLSSLTSPSGLQYRFGVHKNKGHPQSMETVDGDPPSALLPGVCAKAAFSYRKNRDIWRQKLTEEDEPITTPRGTLINLPYDVRLKQPHAAISGIIGGTCAAWFGGKETSLGEGSQGSKRSPLSADLFGSVCYTFQQGKFKKLYNDLTRVDARLDMRSASGFAKRVFNIVKRSSTADTSSSPRLNLIFQQQLAGPIVFRLDSQFLLDSSSEKWGPHMEDLIYSLTYSLRLLKSGKVVAWYSPKRKEGMIELRLFEF